MVIFHSYVKLPEGKCSNSRYMLKNMEDYVPPEGWKPQRLVKKRLGHRRHSTIIHLLHLALPRNGAYGFSPAYGSLQTCKFNRQVDDKPLDFLGTIFGHTNLREVNQDDHQHVLKHFDSDAHSKLRMSAELLKF